MEKPSWVKIVGALMLMFGGCGVTNDIKQVNSEELTEFSIDLANELSRELGDEEISDKEMEILIKLGNIDTSLISEGSDNKLATLTEAMKAIAYMPPNALKKVELHGKIGLAITLFYALAGLLLLLFRKHVLKIAITTLIISLIFVIYQAVDLKGIELSKVMKMGLDINLYFGALLDIILLVIIVVADKSFFHSHDNKADHYDSIDPV